MTRALGCLVLLAYLAITVAFGGAVARADDPVESPVQQACDGKAAGDPCMDDERHCARTLCQHAVKDSNGTVLSSSSYQCLICDRAIPMAEQVTAHARSYDRKVLALWIIGGLVGVALVIGIAIRVSRYRRGRSTT